MLNKLKAILGLGVILQVVKVFFPGLDLGDGFEGAAEALIDSLYIIVPIVISWFVKESPATVSKLVTK